MINNHLNLPFRDACQYGHQNLVNLYLKPELKQRTHLTKFKVNLKSVLEPSLSG